MSFNYSHLVIFSNNLLKYAITIKNVSLWTFSDYFKLLNDSILHLGGFH